MYETASVNKLRVNDVTVRDGQQSLWATRMRIDDVLAIVRQHAKAGFNALEVWGGAANEAAILFKGEDQWDNLRRIKDAVREGAGEAGAAPPPLMMLLRGQSLVGYKNYPDDIVRGFVRKAAQNGMDIFRVFDGLNDMRNISVAVDEVKKNGKHAQGTICYTKGPEVENPPRGVSALAQQKIFNLDYYLEKARELKAMGCDSICMKDMAGLMEPDIAAELIPAIKAETGIPVVLHMHAGMGLSDATIMAAIKAGVDEVDVSNAGLASGSGHSSAQMILNMMERSGDPEMQARLPGLDKHVLNAARKDLLAMRPKYAKWETPYNQAAQHLIYNAQIPGGMLSNFESQIKDQIKGIGIEYEQALNMVLEEVPRVREELGWPPLVTPCSQIVGVQSVLNVMAELRGRARYSTMSESTKQLLLGELGRTPAPPDQALVAKASAITGRKPIAHRPADDLAPGLEKAAAIMESMGLETKDIEEDILTVAVFEQKGVNFLQHKNTPEKIAEPQPLLPSRLQFRAPDETRKALGNFFDAIGGHVMEALAQTAKEMTRIKTGFFKHLAPEELEYRLQAYGAFINRQVSGIPHRLRDGGFSLLQAEWFTVSRYNNFGTTFNTLMRERCVQLGVKPEFIPQLCPVKLAQTFEGCGTVIIRKPSNGNIPAIGRRLLSWQEMMSDKPENLEFYSASPK